MEAIAEMLYTASLENFFGVPLKERMLAETRFCNALECAEWA